MLSAEIRENDKVVSTIWLQDHSGQVNPDFLEADNFEKVAGDKNGNGIFSSTGKIDNGKYLRLDFAKNENELYALFVEHRLNDNYPEIEKLQAFVRKSIVICR